MTALPHPELEEMREEFPLLSRTTYLSSCSLGALSRRSMGYLAEFQARWNALGAAAWYELWLGRLADVRAGLAALLNARPAEVALSPSVSGAVASLASAIDTAERPKVVVSELDFPTVAYQWLNRPGVEVVQLPSDDGATIDPARWAEAVDERTALVATSHVFFTTGAAQDVAAIAETCRAAGALLLVDGYHALGQLPVDPRGLGADIYLAGALKWMLGGPGLAYLWVREERLPELVPTAPSWFGVEDQFDFVPDRITLRGDARRFELGTPALPTVHTALGGMEVIREAGPQRIRERIRALTGILVRGLEEAGVGVRCAADAADRTGIVMADAGDPARAREAVAALGSAAVVVDARDRYVRLSPHFYNTGPECERALELLTRCLASG